jgi:uncharacterized protein GlcG (DUF336 family)
MSWYPWKRPPVPEETMRVRAARRFTMRTGGMSLLWCRLVAVVLATLWTVSVGAQAPARPACGSVPDHATLRAVLQSVISQGQEANTGMGNQAWAAVVNRDGLVCAVVFSGPDRAAQWPGSRVVAAEKASTANALSGPNVALSTANLYYASQPGQSLFSLTTSAPQP